MNKGPYDRDDVSEELLRKLYYEDDPNASLDEVGEKLGGVHRETVRRWMKFYGIPIKSKSSKRPRKASTSLLGDKEWMAEQLKTKSCYRIAKDNGLNQYTVMYWAHKHDLISDVSNNESKKIKSERIKRSLAKTYPDGRDGEFSSNWQGGMSVSKHGYIQVYVPDHPYAHSGKVFEHRLVMERVLGRYLEPDEVVHHLNGVKTDNRPENLELKHRGQHVSEHFKASHQVLEQREYIELLEQDNARLRARILELSPDEILDAPPSNPVKSNEQIIAEREISRLESLKEKHEKDRERVERELAELIEKIKANQR